METANDHDTAAVLRAINTVLREALSCETEAELARTCLAVAEELTNSQFGFIGELNAAGRIDTIAISEMGREALHLPGSDALQPIHDMEPGGLLAQPLLRRLSMVVNDPAAHPDAVGTPGGHPRWV